MKEKCSLCGQEMKLRYSPMEEWGVDGALCGSCYSKRIGEHYPGGHVRVNRDSD